MLDELDVQGFLDDAVVVFTSDHGELGGAHGMSGKGATAYREQNHVPLVIKHPDVAGGGSCDAVTSHVDLVPTILGCAGAGPDGALELPGRDLGSVLSANRPVGFNDVRDGALYSYNMFAYLDAGMIESMAANRAAGTKPTAPPEPDFTKRGAIRSVFDGRYRFTRYFAPDQHHRPVTIEEIRAHNDLELFDLEADPEESENLAHDLDASEDLVVAMNAKLNRLVEDEVGVDDGGFLPPPSRVPWDVERWDL